MTLIATRIVQVYRLKHRPLDMHGMQDEVLDGLGMQLPKDIGDHEFGVIISFTEDLDPSWKDDTGTAASTSFWAISHAILRRFSAIPPHTRRMR